MITKIDGTPVRPLGLAAHPDQDPRCVGRALDGGIDFFFFYSPGHKDFVAALKPLLQPRRDEMVLASGSGARTTSGLRTARRKILTAVGTEMLDIFFAEYINPGDEVDAIFGQGGVLDELQQWKADGSIRFVGGSAHDRTLAKRLARDPRVDVLMHRYNMAHRKAAAEVFPPAIEAETPIIAFTATRWSTLLRPHPEWPNESPTAVDCYRFCLSESAIQLVLTAPKSLEELGENLAVLKLPPMRASECERWQEYGDLIYAQGQGKKHAYESRWP
jgi:aryl-alcohol dehydrogenase-like predicted oxidoreductase